MSVYARPGFTADTRPTNKQQAPIISSKPLSARASLPPGLMFIGPTLFLYLRVNVHLECVCCTAITEFRYPEM